MAKITKRISLKKENFDYIAGKEIENENVLEIVGNRLDELIEIEKEIPEEVLSLVKIIYVSERVYKKDKNVGKITEQLTENLKEFLSEKILRN